MKFSCLKSELVQAIQIAGRSIASKPQTPILSGIYIKANDDALEIQATDYEIGVILHVAVAPDRQCPAGFVKGPVEIGSRCSRSKRSTR